METQTKNDYKETEGQGNNANLLSEGSHYVPPQLPLNDSSAGVEKLSTGYVRVYRKLQEKGYYKDSHYVHLWVHLLLSANHKRKEILWNGKIVTLNPGQFITGRHALSNEVGIDSNKVERMLKIFEKEHQIEQQKTNKFRIISICNWSEYQYNEQQNEQPVNNKRTTSEQQVNTNNNDKNKKNEKNIYGEFVKLTNEEYQKLTEKFGKQITEEKITELNEGIGSKGYKYDSHYHTILSWHRKHEKEKVSATPKKQFMDGAY